MSVVTIDAGLRRPRAARRVPSRDARSPVVRVERPVLVRPVLVRPVSVRPVSVRPVSVRPVSVRPVSVRPVSVGCRPAPVRLTRRGRLVVVVLLLVPLFAALSVFGSHSAATGEAGTPVPTRTVEVGPGDTLWGIAATAAPPGHVREMVHEIQELNAMPGPGVSVGQEIAVPSR